MKKSYYNITLDIKGIQSQAVLRVKQFDTSRVIYMSLTDGGKPYTIGEKCYAVFEAIKPDGTKVGNNCYIEKNKIVYEITEQTVAVSGIANCEVSLYDADGGLITSPRFTLIIDRKLVTGDEFTSSSEYTSLVECLIRAEASEKEREDAEDERRDTWNTVLDSPKVWELKGGCIYRVSGFVAIDNEGVGFYVADKSLLVVNKDGDKTIFYLYLGGYGELPYDIIIGATDGTTADWWGVESEKNKTTEITEESTDEQYPSAKAVKQAIDEALEKFEIPEQDVGSGVSEAQRQTLLAVVNAIGLFNVANAQTLLDNFNKAWDIVEPVPATSITLDKTEITFTTEDTQTIVASVLPLNTTDVVVWKSSNTSIATVKGGVVTPLVDGETVITATAGNISATCKVTVNIYGEIENPVFLQMGYVGRSSTATSEPVINDEYPETASFSAVPVKKGDTLVCKTNIFSPKVWLQFFIFGADGSKGTMIYSTEALGWDTVVATKDGFIRTNIMGSTGNHYGTIAEVSEYSVTSQGIKTTYTVVDKR